MFNNIYYIDEYVKNELTKNHNRRFSSLFRDCRKRLPLIGDYPIMARVAFWFGKFKLKLGRPQIVKACNSTQEYKELTKREKMRWTDNIIDSHTEV